MSAYWYIYCVYFFELLKSLWMCVKIDVGICKRVILCIQLRTYSCFGSILDVFTHEKRKTFAKRWSLNSTKPLLVQLIAHSIHVANYLTKKSNLLCKGEFSRTGIEPVTDGCLVYTTVHRSTNWAIESFKISHKRYFLYCTFFWCDNSIHICV